MIMYRYIPKKKEECKKTEVKKRRRITSPFFVGVVRIELTSRDPEPRIIPLDHTPNYSPNVIARSHAYGGTTWQSIALILNNKRIKYIL